MEQSELDVTTSNDEALEIEILRADIAALSEYNSELLESVSELSDENSALQSDISGLTEQNTLLQSNIDAITEQNGILQSALSEQNQILQTTADTLIEQNNSVGAQLEKIQYTLSIFLCFLVIYTVYAIGKKAYKILSSFF